MDTETPKKNGSRRKGFLVLGGLVVLAMIAGGAGVALGSWNNVCYDCPSIAQLNTWEPKQSTKILTADGSLLAELAQQRRTPVDFDSLAPYVPEAFIAVEDKRFYHHPGFDIYGYLRAAKNMVLKGGIHGGGSTITVQLARHMFIEEIGFDQSFRRKLKELHVALDLERVYTKNQILQAYMNQINYGHGWYGIESAARNYFGIPASHLDPGQAALLAAVVNRPGYYDPLNDPDRARDRRNLVLDLMVKQGYLTREEGDLWKQTPVPTQRANPEEGTLAPYFVEWVRGILDDRFGSDLYTAGYRVYTTLDVNMQRLAKDAMRRGYARIEDDPQYKYPTYARFEARPDSERVYNDTSYIQGMFLALDPKTGDVKALIGGRNFKDSKFNRAIQARRQPGSVFKPFVYTAALASGIPASHIIYDTPVTLDEADGTKWSPTNYSGNFHGPLTLREALYRSINVVAVKLGMEVGIETVAQYAQRLGIQTPIPRVPSTAIGAASVIPIQVAEAYTTFDNLGVRVQPRPILRVEDANGNIVWQAKPERDSVLDNKVAFIMLDMMRDVVNRGSAYAVRDPNRGALPYSLPAAGKTGTTNEFSDVWFMGFTPTLLAGAWFGFDKPRTIAPGAAGGRFAAPVWADFMRQIYFGRDSTDIAEEDSTDRAMSDQPTGPLMEVPPDWVIPEGMVVKQIDIRSGKLATQWCPKDLVRWEVFIPGTEPTELCDLHGPAAFGAPLRGLDVPTDSLAQDSVPPDSLLPARYRRPPTSPPPGG
jgi:1A family penicillin-binding protein